MPLDTALLIIHGLVAVALLGAITHQTIAAWVPARAPARLVLRPLSRRAIRLIRQRDCRSLRRLRAAGRDLVPVLSGSISGPTWSAPAIGRRSASLTSRSISSPSDWRCCPPIGFVGDGGVPTNPSRTRAALTLILAFIVWWSFLIGHVLNNIMGFGR